MNAPAKRFDYSAPPLLPLAVAVDHDGVLLAAGGVELRFRGALFRVAADHALQTE